MLFSRLIVTLAFITVIPWVQASLSHPYKQGPSSPLRQYIADYEAKATHTPPQISKGDKVQVITTIISSLSWRSPQEVNQTLWRHALTIAIPEERRSNNAILIVEGGSSAHLMLGERHAGDSTQDLLVGLAKKLHAVVALISAIPNQPLIFGGDGISRREDDLIGYSWAKFLTSKDPTWLAQFPMVKSVVSALNVAEEILRSQEQLSINGWMLTGASKRGWITWLTAAMDPRVIGIAPIVIDVLNFIPSMRHHYSAYGFWAEALNDYVGHGIMAKIDTQEMQTLASLIDPYAFRAYYQMPKMLLNAANDEFFLPDSSLLYFDQLPGKKYLRYVPNSGHHINNPEVIFNLLRFFNSLDGTAAEQLPELGWHYHNGVLNYKVDRAPLSATLWQAINPQARDFRFKKNGNYPHYEATPLSLATVQDLAISPPQRGWKSFFVELTFPGSPGTEAEEISLTTSAFVIGAH